MDIALLFFFPLIGGFTFATTFLPLRYAAAREETQRLYYRAAVLGVLLSALGALLHLWVLNDVGWYRAVMGHANTRLLLPLFERPTASAAQYSPEAVQVRADVAVVCFWALLLGCCGWLCNLALLVFERLWRDLIQIDANGLSPIQRLNRRAIKDQLELLLADALTEGRRVQVTLSNHKVYVGDVLESPDPASPLKHFRLQPWMSGHRSTEDGQVYFNTFYSTVLDTVADHADSALARSFQLVIPVDKVVTVSGFDLLAYLKFAESNRPVDTQPEEPPPPQTRVSGEIAVRLLPAQPGAAQAVIGPSP
jgi:hypothetical protein